jgi:hypothetical protein
VTARVIIATLVLLSSSAAVSPLAAQLRLEGAALVGRTEHRVDAGFGVASSVGTSFGAMGRVQFGGPFELEARALGGKLSADSLARDDRSYGELRARGSVLALPWLALQGSATIRTYDLEPARQRWTQLGAGAEARFDFASGVVRSHVRATLLPHVAVSGLPAPDFGIAGATGIQVNYGRLLGALEYEVERYVFPTRTDGGKRREQLAGLGVRLGARW